MFVSDSVLSWDNIDDLYDSEKGFSSLTTMPVAPKNFISIGVVLKYWAKGFLIFVGLR